MKIKEYLDFAAEKYYRGEPIISDEEFDALAEQYGYLTIGNKHPNGIAHAFQMYSLKKYYPEDQVPFHGISTIKLDGAAVSALYVDGNLTLGLTRGDGTRGQDITPHLSYLICNQLPTDKPPHILQVVGEVVAKKTIPNARNYAAGALNLKNVEEFKLREVEFIAYGLQPYLSSSYEEDINLLYKWGFYTVLNTDLLEYPSDGLVVRIDNNKEFKKLGYTSHHPRGAYALKDRKEGVVTRLKHVIWNVGRSGVVSPVAILDPINIDGAEVSRATLHNIKYIQALELEEGCKVRVIRSGDIIPRIVEKVAE